MTSNRSFCNAGVLLRSGLKQQAPLLLVSVISSFLTMPVMMIVFLQDQIASRTIFASEQEFLESLQDVCQQAVPDMDDRARSVFGTLNFQLSAFQTAD